MFLRSVAIGAALLLLAGCGPSPEEAKLQAAHEAVKLVLSDPESAQFTLEKVGDKAVCGFVNAKNKFGGYTGAAHYIAPISGNGPTYFVTDVTILGQTTTDTNVWMKAQAICPDAIKL